jgi:FkbM family methyltransferase
MLKNFRRYRTSKLVLIIIFIVAIRFLFKSNKSAENPTINELKVGSTKSAIDLYDLKQANDFQFDCIKTKKVLVQTTICLHDIQHDVFVSKTLKEKGIWEEDLVTSFMRMLSKEDDIHVLDVGAQLGQYCLFAAKFGRKCLAVEPFYDSYVRLHKSSILENTQDLITLVVNGISDIGGEMKQLSHVDNNFGGQSIFENKKNYADLVNDGEMKKDKYMIRTVTLNDLAFVLPKDFKKAIMKIDIQNYELKAFTKSELLFDSVDILVIFLEWDDKKKTSLFPDPKEIEEFLDFMYGKKYSARNPSNFGKLSRNEWKEWPYDIIWIRDDFLI